VPSLRLNPTVALVSSRGGGGGDGMEFAMYMESSTSPTTMTVCQASVPRASTERQPGHAPAQVRHAGAAHHGVRSEDPQVRHVKVVLKPLSLHESSCTKKVIQQRAKYHLVNRHYMRLLQ
jgi:hypothetical protein